MKGSVQGEAVETLVSLGLNYSQARVYLALVENGLSTAKEISKYSGVNRQEIYRITPKLERIGLIEEILGIPTKWEAIPIKDGLSILLENREKETSELQNKATKIASYIKESNERAVLQEGESKFVIMPGKSTHLKWLKNRLKDTQKTNDTIITWSDHKVIKYSFNEEIKEQAKRGIKTRLIIYVSKKEKTTYKSEQKSINNHNHQRLFIFTPPLVLGAVIDNKELILATEKNNPIQRSENVLISTSPSLIALFENYFEQLWKTAHENRNEEH